MRNIVLFVITVLMLLGCDPKTPIQTDCKGKDALIVDLSEKLLIANRQTETVTRNLESKTKEYDNMFVEKTELNGKFDSLLALQPIHDTITIVEPCLPCPPCPPDSVRVDTIVTSPMYKLVELFPDSIRVDTTVEARLDLMPSNMIDGKPFITREDRGTRWAVPGYPHQVAFYFSEVTQIDQIQLNVFAWNEGYTHTFKVYNYPDLIYEGETDSLIYSTHEINFNGSMLYFDFTGGQNSWLDIGEIKFFQKELK